MRVRKKKEQAVEKLRDSFNRSQGYIIFSLLKLESLFLNRLRLEAKENNGLVEVPKKTLLYKANPSFPFSDREIKEPLGILWSFDRDLKSFKILKALKEEIEIKILGGYAMENRLDAEKVWEIINLPEKEVLYSKLLGIIASPILRTQFALSQTIRKLILTLSAIKK